MNYIIHTQSLKMLKTVQYWCRLELHAPGVSCAPGASKMEGGALLRYSTDINNIVLHV